MLFASACGYPEAPASPEPANKLLTVPASTPLGSRVADPALSLAKGQALRFERISVEHGLSQSTVNCVLQDSKGFMWFGTDDGLNKYDGYSFTVYKHDPDDPHSLSHNRVKSVFEDQSGELWIGTWGGGLNKLDRDTGQFTHYDTHDFQNYSDAPEEYRNVVWSLLEDPSGVFWIASYGGGLVRFDRAKGEFKSYIPDPNDPFALSNSWIYAMLLDHTGILWLGTDKGGLYRFDTTTEHSEGAFIHYRSDPTDPTSLSDDQVTALLEDRFGVLWIGTYGGGLDRFDRETETFAHYQHDPTDAQVMRHSLSDDYVSSLYEDASGELWIGTYGGGLNRFDPETESFTHFQNDPDDRHSLSSNRIHAIYEDQSGTLWIGTRGGGVSRSNPASGRFSHYLGDLDEPNSLSDYQVLSIYEDAGGILWIGTAAGGLDAFDREKGEWRHYRHDPDDPSSLGNDTVYSTYEDSSGLLWIGTNEGLYRFDRETERFVRVPHDPPDPGGNIRETIYSILEDRDGVFWFGTHGRGLSEFDPETEYFVHHLRNGPFSISSNFVRVVYEDRSGVLWVGTLEGLNYLDKETGHWHHYLHNPSDPSSLSHNWVISIYEDQTGVLWIGSLGGGLNKFDPETETFTHYREKAGLANNNILDILDDGHGNLWLGTANGLSMFDLQTKEFKNYDISDGLSINEFSAAYKSDSGEMFFGGINGFFSFFPDQLEDNPYVPPVVLTSLQQNGEDVKVGEAPENLTQVAFRWPDNSFEFGFAALNYTQPEKNQHAYMLEGFDEDWNHIGTRRFGRYTNLSGGVYTLRLRGSNNDGVWNEEGTSIKVTVVPPFWQTWWFWGTVVLLLVVGAAGGYRLRIRSLEARSRELEKQVEERTAELRRETTQRTQAEEALRQREREKAITDERNRLARELHDSVTQTLYGVTLYSEAAAGHLALGDTDRVAEHLKELQDTSQEALAEMRLLIFELRPPILEQLGLVAALQARLQAVEGRAGLRTEFKTNLEERLPSDVEEGIYRISLEALNNALKHAQARNIKVHLHQDERRATLEIADDGIGFDLVSVRERGGIGLSAMEERAAELGGRLSVESEPGSGTRIMGVWRID